VFSSLAQHQNRRNTRPCGATLFAKEGKGNNQTFAHLYENIMPYFRHNVNGFSESPKENYMERQERAFLPPLNV
jgi:hypothetical protein